MNDSQKSSNELTRKESEPRRMARPRLGGVQPLLCSRRLAGRAFPSPCSHHRSLRCTGSGKHCWLPPSLTALHWFGDRVVEHAKRSRGVHYRFVVAPAPMLRASADARQRRCYRIDAKAPAPMLEDR